MMNRRDFLRVSGAVPAAGLALARSASSTSWRVFEVTTQVEVLRPSGETRVWLPAALTADLPWQRTLSNTFRCADGQAKLVTTEADAMAIVAAEFPAGAAPVLTVVSRVATLDRFLGDSPTNAADLQYWLRPTKLVPTDGIVRETAVRITAGSRTDADKARAIYEWVVENTARNPKIRGCGRGDIRFMLESGDLSGKCADLNALFVGLARAAGLPARHIYGIRTAPSQLGYQCLGSSSEVVTKGQHCRAEVWLSGSGWVASDPADVRKLMLEEPPGNRPLDDGMVRAVRQRLFGAWEGNWMAFNFGHDVALPGSSGPALGYFMYPQAETAEGRVDPFDPDRFRYTITSREMNS